MRWPFVTRKKHEQEMAAKEARIAALVKENNRLIAADARQHVTAQAHHEMVQYQRKLRIAK